MFETDFFVHRLLECNDDGINIGIEQVWEIEEPTEERVTGVIELALEADREVRYFATLTLLEWLEPAGLIACKSLLDSGILNNGPLLSPHRLWSEDCCYEELATRVIDYPYGNEDKDLLIKKFLSPEIYGKFHFLDGFFVKRLTLKNTYTDIEIDLRKAMKAAAISRELTYPEFQASLCFQPLAKINAITINELEPFLFLRDQRPDPRFEVIKATSTLKNGQYYLRKWKNNNQLPLMVKEWIEEVL